MGNETRIRCHNQNHQSENLWGLEPRKKKNFEVPKEKLRALLSSYTVTYRDCKMLSHNYLILSPVSGTSQSKGNPNFWILVSTGLKCISYILPQV